MIIQKIAHVFNKDSAKVQQHNQNKEKEVGSSTLPHTRKQLSSRPQEHPPSAPSQIRTWGAVSISILMPIKWCVCATCVVQLYVGQPIGRGDGISSRVDSRGRDGPGPCSRALRLVTWSWGMLLITTASEYDTDQLLPMERSRYYFLFQVYMPNREPDLWSLNNIQQNCRTMYSLV